MKQFALPLLTLMIGLVLGSWGPRSDLRAARSELSRLKLESKQEKGSRPIVNDVTKMLGVTAPRKNTAPKPPASNPGNPPTPDPETSPSAFSTPSDLIENRQDLTEALEAAQDLWKVRQAQAHQLLIDNLKLTEQESLAFDQIAKDMNDKLKSQIESTVNMLKNQETLTPEDGLAMVHGISGILLDAYSELDKSFPENWRENMTEDNDLLNFVDPSVAMPLLDLDFPVDAGEIE